MSFRKKVQGWGEVGAENKEENIKGANAIRWGALSTTDQGTESFGWGP